MMRSLYSGVAGLKTHQTRMDVIGNNIANVNTTAYKSQSMTFSDLMYQTTQSASGANASTGTGGTNARQIGLGSKTGAIKTAITTQGASQTTSDPFDLMITGENFFVVSNGQENLFTRDGSFYVDGAGNLCMTSTGYNVMGWLADDATGKIKQDLVKPLQIMAAKYMTYPPEITSKAEISGIIDAQDVNITSDEGRLVTFDFYNNLGYKYTAQFRMTDVDDGGTPPIIQEGQFKMELVKITDSEGEEVKIAGAVPTEAQYKDIYNSDQIFKFNNTTGALEEVTNRDTALTKTATSFAMEVTSLGEAFKNPNPEDPALVNRGIIVVDASAMVNFNNNGASTVTCTRGDSNGAGGGRMLGEMSGVSIQKDGMIYATYDNGQRRLLGQIATAAFANASGLEKQGDNLYSATQNSGDFDGIGVDITAGGGYMNSGVLEMSNVDLSAEFTEMITTQRGFQANSRIITVSDTLLEELTNLKR